MSDYSLRLVDLIRQNTATVLTFAFSRAALLQVATHGLKGEWKQYRDTLLRVPEAQAERALMELALFLRHLDDDHGLSDFVKEHLGYSLGTLFADGRPDQELTLRDISNKVIHAARLEWDATVPGRPVLICVSREPKKWTRATVDVLNLASVTGNMIDKWGAG